jgi:putative cardiolipin synthase
MSFRFYFIVPLIALLGACATVDFDYPKPESSALENTGDTIAGKRIAPLVAAHPGESGFYLSYDGIDAFAARLLMAKRAERSLDAQYYLITKDLIGFVFIGALLKAADRGVRVRLLLDDIQTKGYDAGMAALDSHPNFEVRIFNPFAGRSGHLGDALGDFGRVNRRMHNKSFTIDNQITLIGGRNIAAEYFSAREDVNFGDVDVVGIGPVVNDVSKMFDSYWNHVSAAPVPAFADMPDDPAEALEQLRIRIEAKLDEIRDTPYADAVRAELMDFEKGGGSVFTWAPYVLAYDSPDKSIKDKAEEAESITTTLARAIRDGQKELIVISPYFVPQKRGVAFFQELRDRGMEITVITNSLASTNHAIVHSGYAPSRKPLLKMGVKLYEIKHDPTDVYGVARGGPDASLATLHTKAFIVDRNNLFVGSFNWDPRSVDINTELGVIIESPELGGLTAGLVDESLATRTYEVILNEQGEVRWVDHAGDEPVVLTKEPDTSWWRRFTAGFYRILPVKGQL